MGELITRRRERCRRQHIDPDGRFREMVMPHKLRIKRVYQPRDAGDGVRVLVDRLWPRGLSRERARIDLWLKEIAPSDALRRRYHGDPAGWEAFKTAYYAELERVPAQSAVCDLLDRTSRETVTLLFAARDEIRNNAVALKEWLDRRAGHEGLEESFESPQ
jgi:uncharacterized protein YeaO (DUF488 family)